MCLIVGVLLGLSWTACTRAEPVVSVVDGDSLVVRSGKQDVDVRLAEVDAPELDQPFGADARTALEELVGGKDVRLELVSGGAYRRIIARVYVGDLDVGAELVRRGLAWIHRAYDPVRDLMALEDSARNQRLGLWAAPNPVAPWLWRKGVGANDSFPSDPTRAMTPVKCGEKRYCREMSSCEEARAYMEQCKLHRLDGDRDSIPCEKLCRYYR